MKTEKHSFLALAFTALIILCGMTAIFIAKNLLHDHKEEAVSVNMPSGNGLYFAQQNTDITLSYPWDGVTEGTEFLTEGAPEWLSDSNESFSKIFSVYPTVSDTEYSSSFAVAEGTYYLKYDYTNSSLGYSKEIDLAFEEVGGLISFNIIDNSAQTPSSDAINAVYEAIGESAYSNQKSDEALIIPLDELTAGKTVNLSEYRYNEEEEIYEFIDTSDLSFFKKDPISDFFRKYCSYCSENKLSNKDAQHIYTLLRYGNYGCIYSNGQIYLTYSITDFGTLTLVWSVEKEELCAMSVDAREANPGIVD